MENGPFSQIDYEILDLPFFRNFSFPDGASHTELNSLKISFRTKPKDNFMDLGHWYLVVT